MSKDYNRPYGIEKSGAARCVNSEPGSFGHECGKPGVFIGRSKSSGFEAVYCAECRRDGAEARNESEWRDVPIAFVPQRAIKIGRDQRGAARAAADCINRQNNITSYTEQYVETAYNGDWYIIQRKYL